MKPCCERDHDGDGNCDRHPALPVIGPKQSEQLRIAIAAMLAGRAVTWFFHKAENKAAVERAAVAVMRLSKLKFEHKFNSQLPDELPGEILCHAGRIRFQIFRRPEQMEGVRAPIFVDQIMPAPSRRQIEMLARRAAP